MKHSCNIPIRTSGKRHPAWVNFIVHIKIQKYGTNIFGQDLDEWFPYRAEKLAEFKATYNGKQVIFDSEQDKMFFLLRWS